MDLETIKRNTDILQWIGNATELKKVANTEDGEWAGPCPFCGGEDRFHVQPYHPDGGRWFCRGCGGNKWHSVIDYVMKRDNVDLLNAVGVMEGPRMDIMPIAAPEHTAVEPGNWGNAAYQFLEDSVACLWSNEGNAALLYLHNRGLKDDTLRYWAIGFNALEGYGNPREWGVANGERVFLPRGIVIPCWKSSIADITYLKIRRSAGEPRYTNIKGGKQWLFGGFTFINTGVGFLFESELDVMLAWQTGLGCGYASIPASQHLQPEYYQYFQYIDYLIVAMDNDDPGQKAADGICKRSKHYIKSQPFPAGKDLTEYYQSTGKLDDITEWLYAQLEMLPRG